MIEIRNATPEEYEAIADLTLIVYVGGGFVETHSPYVDQLRDTAARAEMADIKVAVMGDQIVGSVTIAEPGSPYAEVAEPGELEFRMLAVSPEARSAGVGTALVHEVLKTAYDRGDRAVVISTMPDMAAARRIYDRAGFAPVPERNWAPVPGVELTVLKYEIS
ncbi:GNAT family N-acetyltransferase [Rhodococcus sp. NPDC049939]|uniref:GNAT family N-acetyltransferase n=1 Tax=Rhodococcus sp. NPDC049939 TaxID=3155511 RepID=UPI0033EF2095